MSRHTLYATDGLVYNGRSYKRGDVIEIPDEDLRDRLTDEGRISTTEPQATPLPGDPAAEVVSIADFSTEDLVAELEERPDYEAPTATTETTEPFDYDGLKVDDLEKLVEARKAALEVVGTGDNGKVLKADLVKTLTDADAALAD